MEGQPPPQGTATSGTATAPVTYPHLGTLMVGAGLGLTTFAGTSGDVLPPMLRGILAGFGTSLSAVGLFLLGRSSV